MHEYNKINPEDWPLHKYGLELVIANSFFYSMIQKNDFENGHKIIRSCFDISRCNRILFPIHLGVHLIAEEINLQNKCVTIYDSYLKQYELIEKVEKYLKW